MFTRIDYMSNHKCQCLRLQLSLVQKRKHFSCYYCYCFYFIVIRFLKYVIILSSHDDESNTIQLSDVSKSHIDSSAVIHSSFPQSL